MIYLRLFRIDNWVKNVFIFLPLFFSAEILDPVKFLNTLIVFFGFSLVTSCIYIINDIFDLEYDKIHPEKKFRPIAAGKISIRTAIILGVIIAAAGFYLINLISFYSLLLTLLYFTLNFFYSLILKHIPIIDFVVISLGFVIRILIGGEINDIALSQWIIVMVLLLSIFIAVSKRRDDVYLYEMNDKINRRVVTKYTTEFMDKILTIVSSVLIVSYLLFITSKEIIDRYESEYLIVSFLFVLIGVFRYNHLTYVYHMTGSPIRLLFKDKFLQLCLLFWFATFFVVIYLDKIFDV